MMHHCAYTNAKLNSPLQQKGNGTMPIDSDDNSTKTISAENWANNTDDGAAVNTGHAAEHVWKEASDNFNAIQNADVSFNLVWWLPFLFG
jgi:hypothetical protein